jgi:TolB-like protein/lipopolysaccharide biosynthesis regulator YciM
MSPEQSQGKKVDQRSDIWSLGVVLYEMITGKRPFKGDYDQALVYAIVNEEPEPLTGLRTGVPMELERIVKKALSKKPEERYQHVGDLLVDLRILMKHVESTSITPQPIMKKERIRKRLLIYSGIVAVIIILILMSRFLQFPKKVEDIESIAVLPLENLSGDPEQVYFSDGMTEAIIAELANISSLKVISRTSVMRYKDTDKSLPEIAGELKVDAVVEGSVLRADNMIRITTQLIEAREDRHLWAKSYERDLHDMLKLQSDVAHDIAHEIRISLTAKEEASLSSAQAINPEAYEAYLRGLYHWNKRTEEDLRKSIGHYEKVIEIEPDFALAYAGLAQTYIVLNSWGFYSHKEIHSKAKMIAEKALEIDNRLAEAYTSLGAIFETFEWNWQEAEKKFRRAIELNPNYATAHQWYAEFLSLMGRHDEALAEMKRALELDPLSLIINQNFGVLFYLARDYDSAIEQFQKTLELEKDFGNVDYYLYWTLLAKGLHKEAVEQFQEILSKNETTKHLTESAGRIYSKSGIKGFFEWVIEEISLISIQPYRIPYLLAEYNAGLSNNDEAFKWLDILYEERYPRLKYIKIDPFFDNIRSDPRFKALLTKMRLE